MASIRSTNTGPERLLRYALWRQGFRYRVNDKRLPGKPDIVLPKYHTVIFVHGCFWHGHKGCPSFTTPKSNMVFWTTKIARNQERDQEEWRQLEAKGWFVIIVWECQLKKAVLDETISRVEAEIRRNGETHRQLVAERKVARESYRHEMKARKERNSALKDEIKNRY